MTAQEAAAYVTELLDANAAHIQMDDNRQQPTPDVRGYLEYYDLSSGRAFVARYKVGFLKQPQTIQPDREIAFISTEGWSPQPLHVFGDRLYQGDMSVVGAILDKIKAGKLSMTLVA